MLRIKPNDIIRLNDAEIDDVPNQKFPRRVIARERSDQSNPTVLRYLKDAEIAALPLVARNDTIGGAAAIMGLYRSALSARRTPENRRIE